MVVVQSLPVAVLLAWSRCSAGVPGPTPKRPAANAGDSSCSTGITCSASLLMALVFAFTLGSMGERRPRIPGRSAASRSANVLSRCLGGVVFNAANILLVAAIAMPAWRSRFPSASAWPWSWAC